MDENSIKTHIFNLNKIDLLNENYENYFNTNDYEELNDKLKDMIEKKHPLCHKNNTNKEEYEKIKINYKEYIENYLKYAKYLMLDKIINRRFRYVKKNKLELNIENVWTEIENLGWFDMVENINNFKNTLERQVMRNFTPKEQMEYFNEKFNEELNEKNEKLKELKSQFTLVQEIETSKHLFESNNISLNEVASKKYDIDDDFIINKNNELTTNEILQNNYLNNINKHNEQNQNISGNHWNEFFKPITNQNIVDNINTIENNNNNLSIDDLEKKRNDEINNIHTLNNYVSNSGFDAFNNSNIYFLWNN